MTRNLYRAFLELVPTDPLLVGEVVAYADGVATVELPDGGTLQARGAAAVGNRVFVRAGLIESEAPALTAETIEV